MKPVDLTVNDENQDVNLSGKCIDRAIENPSLKNVVSSKIKNALLLRVSYDNVYSKKPIFRRKLIEKYSTARYNFNTKRIYCSPAFAKKKAKRSIIGDDFDSKSDLSNSNKARFCINGNIKATVVTQDAAINPLVQSFVDTEKSIQNDQPDTVINSTDCRVVVPKLGENSISTNDKTDINPRVTPVPFLQTSNGFKNDKPAKSVSVHRSRSDQALVVPSTRSAESSSTFCGSESLNLKTSGSFLECEDSDSNESTYLTVSFVGDSDSLSSISSEDYIEESCDCDGPANVAEHTSCKKFSSSELTKSALNVDNNISRDVDKSRATDLSVTVKSDEPYVSLKKCDTKATGTTHISESDSDSGLQLCTSDGEKSCSDQPKPECQNVDFSQLVPKNVEKLHQHLFSFEKINNWVNNSSQKPSSLKPNSGSNVQASSAPILSTTATTIDSGPEGPLPDSDAISQDVSVAISNSPNTVQLSSGNNKQIKTDEANNKLGDICSKPNTGCEIIRSDDSNRKELAEKIVESLNSDTSIKSNFKVTGAQSSVSDKESSQGAVLLQQNFISDEKTNGDCKKSIEKWKLIPSAIYQYLSENYKTEKKDGQVLAVQKRKKKKGQAKRLLSHKKKVLPKKVPEKSHNSTLCRDPYLDAWKELEIKEESTEEASGENTGMILHVGVNRPLFPEVYRNIVALNNRQDEEITDLWASFALTTLITHKSSKRFRSVFLPVKDTKLKSVIDEFQQKTSCEFQDVDLQKVTLPSEDSADDVSVENVLNTRKRKNSDGFGGISAKLFGSSSKKKKTEKSTKRKFYKVDFPTNPPPASGTPTKRNWMSRINYPADTPMAAVENLRPPTQKLSDEALLAKHGFKPCVVLLPRIPIPSVNTYVEEDEEDDEYPFFGTNHCSRTYGQMFDYRSRNHSLVFFHRIKRILRLQRQNNKLFHSCRYVRLRPDMEDMLEDVDVLGESSESCLDFKAFPGEVVKNPLDILKTWKLNLFEAPLLKGIDANANMFPIRFMNHDLLKSETNSKWFILQLNKCVLSIIHHDKDNLPVELLFQIICRADLTKKVVCNTIGMDFDADVLNFGVYGVPGLCEAVLIGPYEIMEMQHDLTASVQLWNGETAVIPISETSFDQNTFFLWNDDTKVSNVHGLWWKPGDIVPCTSAVNSAFVNHLFNAVESAPSIEGPVRVQSLLRQHPCLTYSKYERAGYDVNVRLIHQASKLNYTVSGLKVSERIAIEDFIVDDSPLLQPTKLRNRTKMPNYNEMVKPKKLVEQKSVLRKRPKTYSPKISVQAPSISERMKMNTENERMRRKEFYVLRSNLCSTLEASQEASLVSILNKAEAMIKSLENDEITLKRTKNNLCFIKKNLINQLKEAISKFPSDHPQYRKSMGLISKLHHCDRNESFTQIDHSKSTFNWSKYDYTDRITSDDVRPIELSKNFNKKNSHTAASRNSKLKRKRNIKKLVWRKEIESRLEPRQHIPEKSEKRSSVDGKVSDVLRSEHSYSRRKMGIRTNGRLPSNEIPLEEPPPSSSSPAFGSAAADSQPERDQVAVYFTENDQTVTKLMIQRLKSVNENSGHLSPVERRNQIIALIRKIVAETVARAHVQGTTSNSNDKERVLLPRLLMLQRLLEGANMRVRDSSKIRVIDETIEISDDDDQDEFSIESPATNTSACSQKSKVERRVIVKITPAQTKPAAFENGVTFTNPTLMSSTEGQPENGAPSLIDEQLSVENQIILNSAGDQVDLHNFIDNTSSLLSLSSKEKRDASSTRGQRKVTLLKRVNTAIPSGGNVPDTNSAQKISPPVRVNENLPGNKRNVVNVTRASPQFPILLRTPIGRVKVLRDLAQPSMPSTPPTVRVYAKKTFSSPNYRKLIALRRAAVAKSPSIIAPSVPFRETDAESSNGNIADHVYATESSDLSVDIAPESSVSIGDYVNVHPTLLGRPILPNKSPVAKFSPNILVKALKSKDASNNVVVIPLKMKNVPFMPELMSQLLSTKERIRCPSFVPPSSHHLSPSNTAEVRIPRDVVASPLVEDDVSQLQNYVETIEADDFLVDFENESPKNDEQTISRRSSVDSSTRLAVKSFASMHSFNDNCFTNMDRLLKF